MRSKEQIREFLAILAMPVMLLTVGIGSVLLTVPMTASGYAVFEEPESLSNPIWFIAMLLVFTAFLLILIRYKYKIFLDWIIRISLFIAYIYVFSGLANLVINMDIELVFVSVPVALIFGTVVAALATLLLWIYPEWYVVDILGVLLAAGVASMFGISLEPVPVILLLILLSIYDAISVYKTKHMLTLADGIIEGRMPIMVVVPKKKGYSFIRDGIGGTISPEGTETSDNNPKHDRAAYLMGLGDLIMPAILVTSAAVFTPGGGIGMMSTPAIGALLGSLAGLCILLRSVQSGKPQAGLPPLNGGAILGFLAGWLLMQI
jgi:presenilin-like A22 family membrane protease